MPPLPQQEQPNPQINTQQALPQPGPVPQQPTAAPAPITPQQQGPPPWESAIPAIAEKHGLDPELLRRMLKQEHGWEAGKPLTSPKGAVGPMQLMPDTAKRYGVDPNDPYQNLGAGAAEISRLLKKYNGHYARALAAYNAGEGAVDKVPNGIPAYPETQNYVMKILQGYQAPAQKTQGSPLTPELGGPALTHGQWLQEQLGAMLPESVQNAMGWMQRNVNIPLQKGEQWTERQFGDVGRTMFTEEYRPPILPLGQQPGVGVPSAVAGGAMEALGGMVGDPRNWLLMPAGAARPVLQRLMSGGFALQMGSAAVEGLKDLYENWDKYTPEQKAEIITRTGIDAWFAKQSAAHMGGPVTDPRTGQVQPGLWGGTRPAERQAETAPTTPTTRAPSPMPVQVAPRQEPSIAQEGGPRPVTSPGISGGREIGGQHPAAGVSAPIEGGGGTTGTVTPKPSAPIEPHRAPTAEDVAQGGVFAPEEERIRQAARAKIGEAREAGLMPDLRQGPSAPRAEGERRQFLKTPEQVQREAQEIMAQQDAAQEAKRQAERERQAQLQPPTGAQPTVTNIDDAIQNAQALVERARATGDANTIRQAEGLAASLQKKKEEVQSAQRPTGLPQAPTATPTAAPGEPVQRGAAEAPAGPAGQPVRPREEPVREPIRPPVLALADKGQLLPPKGEPRQPWKPLPPEQRPRVPAGEVGRPAPEPAAERKPVEIPKPTPAPKEASAEQRAAWEQKRREEGAQRAAAMAANAPPPAPDRAEKAAQLDRTLTRKLKQSEADEARVPGGRARELDAAIQRERAKGPQAAEKAARQMLNRAGRAQSYIESLQRLAKAAQEGEVDETGKPAPSWDQTLRDELNKSEVRVHEDPNTGRLIPVYKWVTEKGVQGGTRGLARDRAIDAATAEVYNNLRGNKLKEVPLKKAPEQTEEVQAKLAETQAKYDALLQQVRKAGGRPDDAQLKELVDLMGAIHAMRGTRMLAEKGPGSETGEYGEKKPVGTGTPKDFLDEVMGWSQKGHLSKPGPEQITARIGQLQQEMSEARSVAERLRAKGEPGAAPAVAPKPEAPKTPAPAGEAAKPGYGEKNTIFTADRAEAARQRIRDRLKTTLHAGLDPELLKDVAEIMGYHFEAGVREFAELGKRVIQEFGEQVRPYLKDAYEAMLKRGGEHISKTSGEQVPSKPLSKEEILSELTPEARAKKEAEVDRFLKGMGAAPETPKAGFSKEEDFISRAEKRTDEELGKWWRTPGREYQTLELTKRMQNAPPELKARWNAVKDRAQRMFEEIGKREGTIPTPQADAVRYGEKATVRWVAEGVAGLEKLSPTELKGALESPKITSALAKALRNEIASREVPKTPALEEGERIAKEAGEVLGKATEEKRAKLAAERAEAEKAEKGRQELERMVGAPKTPAAEPRKPVEPPKPVNLPPKPTAQAEAPKTAPIAPKAPSADRQKLLALRQQIKDRLEVVGWTPDDPEIPKLKQLLKQVEDKLGPEPVKPAAKPATKPAPKAPDTLKRALPPGARKTYRTGETAPLPMETEPEAPKGPSVQQRIVEALRDNRGLEEFTSAELRRAGEPMRLGKGAEEFKIGAETQKAIAAELSKREGQRGEIEKAAPKLEPAKQAEKRAEHVRVDVVHPDDPEAAPVWGKQAIDREDIHKLGQRVGKLPKGEDRNDLASSLNSTSKAFENLNKRISYLSKAIKQMRDDGVTTRTRVDKNPASPTFGQKITEKLEDLEMRRMRLGLDRSKVIEENVPRLKDTLSALEAKPVAKAPEPVPTKAEPMVIKTYGQEDVYDEQGKLVGKVAPQTGYKAVQPSPAPTEEGEQQRIQSLHQHEADLAKLVRKYGGTPPRKAAIVMQMLRKGIKEIRATLPGGGPASKPYVAPILEGGKLLEKAARAEGKPAQESEIVEARAKGYVTGAPIIGSVDDAADNLHSWLQGKSEAVPSKVMSFIDNTLFKVGPAGQHISHEILGRLAKGEFGDLKGDEAPQKAALRLQKALDVLSEGRVRSLSAPKELSEGVLPQDLQSSVRAKAFSDAMHVAKTGVVPAPKPPKSEQAGFLSFGRRGRAAVPPARAAQVSRNAIGQLAKTVEALPASRGMDRRIEQAMRAGQQAVPTTPGSFANAYQRTVTLGKALAQAFTKLPRWQDFEKSLGDFRLIRTRQAYESRNFVKTIQDKLGVPSLLRRTIHPLTANKEMKAANLRLEAITNYLEAGGNEQELARRASLSGPKVRAGYELASQLNPEEKAIAQAIKEHFESRARDGLALGILHGYVENYAPHIWKDKGHLASISAELNAGLLQKNFRFAMQRIYGSYFEGEQKGLSPKLKRIDALVAVHDNAFNTAMNTRLLARQLIDGIAHDGKPILAFNQSGAIQLTGGQRLDPVKLRMIKRNPALLLKPNSKPFDPNLDMRGYEKIDDPAFQKWIWKGQSGGKNILMQGDAWVHPDYVRQLKNLTSRSALRKSLGTMGGVDIRPGDWALKGVAALKQVQLGAIGSFHYIQEGLHDVWHFRNPLHPDNWNGKRLDQAMTDPTVLEGIRHGLNLYEGGADFGDGGAVLDRIPGMGKYIRASTDHLFKTFIPSLKADLYKHVVQKNLSYYADAIRQGKIDTDQLKTISARTVNNAFGELDTLTRNKTWQDVMRLTLLAPDFLEARARFVGQSLRPYGHVPFMAMMRNIGLLYTAARVLNYAVNKDPLWDGKYWDGVKIGNKVYRVRSIVGDLFHAASNSPSFAYWRLSPAVRPIVAMMAQVRKGVPYRLKDAIADTVPIGLQGEAKKVIFENIKNPDVSRSIWETIGVREEKYYTPEQRKMLEKRSEQRERALRGERSHGLGPLLPSLPRR